MKKANGFTIVELLVIIVVIGILAAFTIVSYTGINTKATISSIQSDLSVSAKQFKLFTVEYGSYPIGDKITPAFDANNCALQPADTKYCLKLSPGNQIHSYVGTATTFRLVIKNGSLFYAISESSQPIALTAPILINPTYTAVTGTGATIGATISSDGGETLTESGTCWGTSANPTTYCTPNVPGALTNIGSVGTAAGSLDVAISSDGQSVYVSGGSNPNRVISMYSRDDTSGLLSPLTTPTIPAGTTNPLYGITVSPNGDSVYAVNYASPGSTTRQYRREKITDVGALSALVPSTIPASFRAYDVVVSPDNKHVYVTYYSATSIGIHSRNLSTGALTYISAVSTGAGSAPRDIVISPDGFNVYAASTTGNGSVKMYSRNESTGDLVALTTASIDAASNASGIAISADGKSVYTANGSSNNISMFKRTEPDGILELIDPGNPTIPAGSSPYHINVSSDGKSVYASNYLGNTISMYSRDTTTGLLTAMATPTIPTGTGPVGVIISPDGYYVYVANQTTATVSIYRRSDGVGVINVPFVQARTGMSSGTIHYRGYAENSIGRGYAESRSFTIP